MSTEVVVRPTGTTDLTIDPGQTFWSDKQVAALRQLGVKDATNGDLAVFFHQSVRTGLDPFAKQIYMIARWTKDGPKQTIQTGIDGYRLIARRAADHHREALSYDDALWCGEDGAWTDVWLADRHPSAAKVALYRGGARFSAVALWREYVQTVKDGSTNAMWSRMGVNQLAKCAEALALRKAFPQDLSGIYTDDEMGQADRGDAAPTQQSGAERMRGALRPTEAVEPVVEPETVESAPPESLTDHTRKQMFAELTEHNITDPAKQRAGMSKILGRTITSRTELSEDDARAVILDLQSRAITADTAAPSDADYDAMEARS